MFVILIVFYIYFTQIWFNNKGWISMVAYMNIMNNLILRAHLPHGADPVKYGISVSNHPMNRTKEQLAIYTLLVC